MSNRNPKDYKARESNVSNFQWSFHSFPQVFLRTKQSSDEDSRKSCNHSLIKLRYLNEEKEKDEKPLYCEIQREETRWLMVIQ